MSTQEITIGIVDDKIEIIENIKRLLTFEDNMEVIGQASNGREAVELAIEKQPDILLMDINMPDMDGMVATEIISLKAPNVTVIMMSVQKEQEYLRKAMMAGARDFLVKPFSKDDLINTIKRVFDKELQRRQMASNVGNTVSGIDEIHTESRSGRVVTFFSTKGGAGKTTLAVNYAVELAKQHGKKVALLDFDLQFGDIAIMMNINHPRVQTVSELVKDYTEQEDVDFNLEFIKFYLQNDANSGIDVLLSCSSPAYAESVKAAHLLRIIQCLKPEYDYIIVDTSPRIGDEELAILDSSDMIIIVATLEITAIRTIKMCLDIMMNHLNYGDDKMKLVLNRAFPSMGIDPKDVETSLNMKAVTYIPSDGSVVIHALNQGIPFMAEASRNLPIVKAISEMVEQLSGADQNLSNEPKSIMSRIKSLFG